MGVELSAKTKLLLNKTHKGPNLILEIDGAPNVYSALEVLESWAFDMTPPLYFDIDEFYFDKGIPKANAKSLISLSGSGAKIQNQLLQDKGGSSSVSTFNIELIDDGDEIMRLVSPGYTFTDILGRNCTIYLNFEGGLHPQDSFVVHKGVITKVKNTPVSSILQVSHPERKKRQKIFIQGSTKLTAQALVGDTTLTVSSTTSFLLPADAGTLTCYVQIQDEIIGYTGKTSTTLTGCTRGQLGTSAAQHEINDEINSIYRLQGSTTELALKLMMSDSGYYGQTTIMYLGGYSPSELDSSIVFFSYFDIQRKLGFVVGDTITIAGATNPANNLTTTILDYGTTDLGSWVQINTSLTLEMITTANATFKSKYDVLPDGMGMTGLDVDVVEHERLAQRFINSFPDFDFKLKEEIDGDFIAKEIYFPSNAYSIPRGARASIGVTAPPIADQQVFILDETNVVNPSKLKPERGFNDNFYNSVIYKYNKNVVSDKFLTGYVNYSADSQNRFEATGEKVGNVPLIIESSGLQDNGTTNTIIEINSRNQLERYQFAPEYINDIEIMSKEGYQIEVGDVVLFGSPALKMKNIATGDRNTDVNYYEVINKSLDVKSANVVLSLLRTSFDSEGRYGTVSPSTYVGVGSTTTEIIIKPSFGSLNIGDERDKWEQFVGYNIRIHSSDFTFDHTRELTGLSGSDPYKITVSPALPSPPSDDYLIEVESYDDTNATNGDKYKLLYAHFDPQITIATGISQTQFTVGAGDVAKLFVGAVIYVHTYDYSDYSDEVFITNITGTTITVGAALGFTPSSSHYIELVGFNDGGKPYRIFVG